MFYSPTIHATCTPVCSWLAQKCCMGIRYRFVLLVFQYFNDAQWRTQQPAAGRKAPFGRELRHFCPLACRVFFFSCFMCLLSPPPTTNVIKTHTLALNKHLHLSIVRENKETLARCYVIKHHRAFVYRVFKNNNYIKINIFINFKFMITDYYLIGLPKDNFVW